MKLKKSINKNRYFFIKLNQQVLMALTMTSDAAFLNNAIIRERVASQWTSGYRDVDKKKGRRRDKLTTLRGD